MRRIFYSKFENYDNITIYRTISEHHIKCNLNTVYPVKKSLQVFDQIKHRDEPHFFNIDQFLCALYQKKNQTHMFFLDISACDIDTLLSFLILKNQDKNGAQKKQITQLFDKISLNKLTQSTNDIHFQPTLEYNK